MKRFLIVFITAFLAAIGIMCFVVLLIPNLHTDVRQSTKDREIKRIAYQFKTDKGQIVTLIHDSRCQYSIPTSTLDIQCKQIPFEVAWSTCIIDVGWATEEYITSINNNTYATLYREVSRKASNQLDIQTTDETFMEISKYFPDMLLDNIGVRYAGKSLNKKTPTIWSSSIADFGGYEGVNQFHLPVISSTVQLDTGEILVVRCMTNLDQPAWNLDAMPALGDVSANKKIPADRFNAFMRLISDMELGYSDSEKFIQEFASNILVGDYSDQYLIVTLNEGVQQNYGIDVSAFTHYAFLTLDDSSIYLVFENNGVNATECIGGDPNHSLTTDWSKDSPYTQDTVTGRIYEISWIK